MASGEDFDRILDACTIAFDGRRADGRLRRGEPAQRSRPRLRGVAQVVCKVATQYVKLVEATHQAGRLGRRGEDRHREEHKRIIDYSLIHIGGRRMQFDHYTISLLFLRPDAPTLADEQAAELQDAHMAHLADLHDAGYLLAAGPVQGAAERELRGVFILKGDLERAREPNVQGP